MSEYDTLSAIVTRWAEIMDNRVANRGMLAACCVLASKVLLVSLTEAGIEAWAEPTYAVASNAASWPLRSVPFEQWPDAAWSVGVRPGDRISPGSYPGHLVVMAYIDGGLMLVDGSAGQFSRPLKNMTIPSVLVVPAAGWPGPVGIRNAAWAMEYKPASLGVLHRVGNDWTKNWREYMPEMRKVTA